MPEIPEPKAEQSHGQINYSLQNIVFMGKVL